LIKSSVIAGSSRIVYDKAKYRRNIMRAITLSSLAGALLLAGCATPTGPVEVTRFNRTSDGIQYGSGSFNIGTVTENGATAGISSSPYQAAVGREMQRIGYSDAGAATASASAVSDVVANIAITVSDLGTQQSRSPVSVGVGGSTGGYRSGVGVGVGLDLTSLLSKPKSRILTELSVKLVRRSDNKVIWEGKAAQEATAGTPAAQGGIAASKLAEALFRNFPGVSGETITVK
jgi:hypothetical protein